MAIVLLDTTVASFLHPRKQQSLYRAAYEPHLRDNLLAMSFQTVAELFVWAEQSKWVFVSAPPSTTSFGSSWSFHTIWNWPEHGRG